MTQITRHIAVDPLIRFSADQLARLQGKFKVNHCWPKAGEQVEGLLIHSKVTEEFIRSLPKLQWIAVRANNLDYAPNVPPIERFGIPSLSAFAVTELTFALMLHMKKELYASNLNVKDERWREGISHGELRKSTLGIIGGGVIGKQVAKVGEVFGMNVLVAASRSNPQGTPLNELLSVSDVVTLHIPSKGNDNFMRLEQFRLMKPSALFINTSRGSVVDETALRTALDQSWIKGAGLDVFKEEPPSEGSIAFHPKVVATPHMGFQTETTLNEMSEALVNVVLEKKGDA